jgi:hypothetical protein
MIFSVHHIPISEKQASYACLTCNILYFALRKSDMSADDWPRLTKGINEPSFVKPDSSLWLLEDERDRVVTTDSKLDSIPLATLITKGLISNHLGSMGSGIRKDPYGIMVIAASGNVWISENGGCAAECMDRVSKIMSPPFRLLNHTYYTAQSDIDGWSGFNIFCSGELSRKLSHREL